MDLLDTKSIKSIEAQSIASMGSGGTSQQVPYNFFSGPKDNVKVVIRVRPLNEKEKNQGNGKKCVSVENTSTIIVEGKPDQKVFNFDFVGHENIEQEQVFNQIAKPIADSCLEGYNGSIFAYGQTGAGKTFTIQGTGLMLSGYGYYDQKITDTEDYEKRGLMSRSFEYIFDSISKAKKEAEDSKGESQYEYLVRCSYLEIYNESIMDLLDPESNNLHIREDIKKGVYVEGLNEEVVSSAQDVLDLILRGSKNRHVGSTSMNKESSRSHSVLTTIIETKSMKQCGGLWNIKSSRFHIIDLAGSERQKFTNAMGERLKEAGMINKSLSALGNVINSLVDISEGKNRHVHYRDSKLTFLLRDSLGGNSKTVIIANISPSLQCMGESISTLKFAQRAKLIRNKAVINEDSSGTIHLLKQEITRLKKELAESEQRSQTNNLQCAFCRNNINGELNMEDELNDDEMLLDQSLLNQSVNLSSTMNGFDESMLNGEGKVINEQFLKKYKQSRGEAQTMRKRIVYLESLLTANLDNLTSQQKFYEQEIQKNQQQNKRLSQAVDSFEKQCARDKMIIKFREDRIQKLESHQPMTADDKSKQMQDLKKEIQLWKDAVDHNPQCAKLFAEKAELQKQVDQFKKETKQTPDSLNAQMRSLSELNEGLTQYLKNYCEESKKEVEEELSRVKLDFGEKIEEFNQRFEELSHKEEEWSQKHQESEKQWNHQIYQYKAEIETLKEKNISEKQEIERLNKEAFEQIKKEIEEISENKTEQEQEAQILKVQIKEKEKDLEREIQKNEEKVIQFQQKEVDFQEDINKLQNSLKQLQEQLKKEKEQAKQKVDETSLQLENERKLNLGKLKEKEESWEKKYQELEQQFIAEQSQRETVEDQCDQMNSRIKQLESDNDTFQQTLLCRQEEVEELRRTLNNKELELEELKKQHQQDRDLIKSKEREAQNLRNELERAIQDCEELKLTLKEIRNEIEQLENEKQNLLKQIQTKTEQIVSLQNQNSQKDQQIQEFQNKLDNIQQEENQNRNQIKNLEEEKQQLENSIKSQNLEYQSLLLQQQNQQQEIIRMKQEYQQDLERVQKEKSDTQMVFKEKYVILEHEKQKTEERYKVQMQQKEEQNKKETIKLQENFEQTLKNKLEQITKSSEEQIQQYKNESEQEQLKLQKNIQDLQELIQEKESNLQQTTSSRTETENSYKLKLMKQEQQHNENIKEIEAKNKSRELEFEENLNNIKQEYQSKETQILIDFQILKKDYENERSKFQIQISQKDKEYEDSRKNLTQKLQNLHEESQDQKKEIEQLKEQNNQFTEQSSEQVKSLKDEINEKNLKIEKLNNQWKEQMAINSSQIKQLEQVDQEMKYMTEQLSKTQQEKDEVCTSVKQVKEIDTKNQQKIKELQQEISQLKKDSESQKKLNDEYLNSVNNEHIKKYQEIQQQSQSAKNALQVEVDSYKSHCKELNGQVAKYKSKLEQQNDILRQNKETISGMVLKENDLMLELEKKINELKDHQDRWKQRVQDSKEETMQLKKEWERLKKENENLRELVKLKDRQIEEQLNQDERERDQTEKLFKENKDLRNQLTKREFEMKEVVRTLKFYSDEKSRLEKELEKLHRENDQLVGHKNPSQKIQHHLKIKEENNKLREENFKLQEELRRKTDILIKKGISMSKDQSPQKTPLQQTNENVQEQSKDDIKKLKKENVNFQETINRLVDHILSQPGLMKLIGINDDIYEKIQQSTGQSKVKNAMEIISLFNNVIQNKDRELKEVTREKKKVDCRLDIIEKEKNLCKQQLELIQNASSQNLIQNQQQIAHQQYRDQDLLSGQQNSKRRLEGITSQERVNPHDFQSYQQQKHSPMYGYKQQFTHKDANSSSKQLNNIQFLGKDLYGNQRNGSGIRSQYLHSNTQNQK